MYVDIEVSRQTIPLTQEIEGILAASQPLHDLRAEAPIISRPYDPNRVIYPFSNDESAAYFDQMQARTATAEYQQATNRVAIVIGESSLTSALRYIPEETIIVLDNSADMCGFMERYLESLRLATTIEQWGDMMDLTGPINGNLKKADLVTHFFEQAMEWDTTGYAHAAYDPDVFTETNRLAREKAIIPWHGDISNMRDMRKLGKALRARDAHVTMVNLSNLLVVEKSFYHAADCVERLEQLPITPNAPILTTNHHTLPPATPYSMGIIMEATGPFFGLENLRRHGGPTFGPRGSATEREYMQVKSSVDNTQDVKDFMVRLLFGGDLGLPSIITSRPEGNPTPSSMIGGFVVSVTHQGLHILSAPDQSLPGNARHRHNHDQ